MGLSEIREDLIIRYNHFLNKRVTFKQKTDFIRSLMVEFKEFSSGLKVVELREKGRKTSLARNVYVGDVKNADVIIATYYDSPLKHLGPYYVLDKQKQRNNTLIFNGLMASILLMIGIVFTLNVTGEYISYGDGDIRWGIFLCFALIYLILIYFIGLFSKGIGRNRNFVRNNSTVVYMINKILNGTGESNKIAYAFLDNGVTNERGLLGLKESVKLKSKIIYLDAIGAKGELRYLYENNAQFLLTENFERYGTYKVYVAPNGNDYLTRKELNSREFSIPNAIYVDDLIDNLLK